MSSLTVTTVQTNLYWEDKIKNLEMLEEKINNIAEKTEIVILPEMFTTGFSMQPERFAETMNDETIAWMKRISATKKVILTGSVMIEENGGYYNRLVWMLPNGQMGIYDKKHLFAFAGEHEHYTGGNKRLIASVKGWRINPMICYDLRFPVWSRQSLPKSKENDESEYDILLYIANWPERRSHMWKTLLQARAIENQSFCIGVNRVGNDGNGIYHSGDTMIVNATGEVMYHKANEEEVTTITLYKADLENIRGRMPFLKDADPFVLLNE